MYERRRDCKERDLDFQKKTFNFLLAGTSISAGPLVKNYYGNITK